MSPDLGKVGYHCSVQSRSQSEGGVRNTANSIAIYSIAEFGTHGVCSCTADGGHDCDDDVLLNREQSRVEGHAEERDLR